MPSIIWKFKKKMDINQTTGTNNPLDELFEIPELSSMLQTSQQENRKFVSHTIGDLTVKSGEKI